MEKKKKEKEMSVDTAHGDSVFMRYRNLLIQLEAYCTMLLQYWLKVNWVPQQECQGVSMCPISNVVCFRMWYPCCIHRFIWDVMKFLDCGIRDIWYKQECKII